jgi:membrane peptidoglycan carboxypeptidase
MSLNIPAIRTLQRVGNEDVADTAEALGLRFAGGRRAFLQAGLAGAIGTVEVRPLDLVSAFGTLANGGAHVPPRMILQIQDRSGSVVWQAPRPEPSRAVSASTAFLLSDILAGNTDKAQNPIWAAKLALFNGPKGQRRPAAVKTGTANDARDLSTYGYLAPPKDPKAPAWAVGVWIGNSDHSTPRTREPAISLTSAAPMWRSFVRRLTDGDPIAGFSRPKGVVKAKIDAWTGGKPGPWTRETRTELFRAGTQPGAKGQVDKDGLLYTQACGTWMVNPVKAELGPAAWDGDVANWLARARRGPGVTGPLDSMTAYFWDRHGWGGPLVGRCAPAKPKEPKDHGNGNHGGGPGGGGPGGGGGHGGGGGGGGGNGDPTPPPDPAAIDELPGP